jgi:two-component system sporulation sensor kinase B
MPLVITVLFVSFPIFGTKYGVLGVRLKFERQRLDSTMRAMTSGTSILNHTIKNEIGKIHMLADRIKYKAVTNVQREINKDIGMVIDSTEHM